MDMNRAIGLPVEVKQVWFKSIIFGWGFLFSTKNCNSDMLRDCLGC